MSLPPGQQVIGFFPRFGTHRYVAAPPINGLAMIRIAGAVVRSMDFPVARLAHLERRAVVADFHCVAGWTAEGLRWDGVAFRRFYESVIVPEATPHPGVSHILFRGADGFRSAVTLQDALDSDVLLADRLGGAALDSRHGAPVRLLSPKQYGYKSTKHLCCIELHISEPADGHEKAIPDFLLALLKAHPRARVSEEERHRYLPAWLIRGLYRRFIPRSQSGP